MLLALFILITYIILMQMIKDDIGQVEHLYVLMLFALILFTLATKEGFIQTLVRRVEEKVGWNNCNKSTEIEPYLRKVSEWLIADYRSSNCRRWVKRLNVYAKRIFFFFNVKLQE